MKKAIIIVLDSLGIGAMPDAHLYGDEGANTLQTLCQKGGARLPNLRDLGLFNIQGVTCVKPVDEPYACYARMSELSKGKDTTTGHWELAGLVLSKAFPTFPSGFPLKLISEIEKATGRAVLCNKPYSGTQVIEDFGEEHVKTGDLIVYTSADSVLQIAAHEDVIPVEELYDICEKVRSLCVGDYAVARIIARPFSGEIGSYERTENRRDFSISPFAPTMLDLLSDNGIKTLGIGKIHDIFSGRGVNGSIHTKGNADGIEKTIEAIRSDKHSLIFTNLVDFDMKYGHRRDIEGYTKALEYFDDRLPDIIGAMDSEDLLIITADHGCDPGYKGTDHTREYVPLLLYGQRAAMDFGTVLGFGAVAATVIAFFGYDKPASLQGAALKSAV